jgi:hypothetical protein
LDGPVVFGQTLRGQRFDPLERNWTYKACYIQLSTMLAFVTAMVGE